MIQFLFKGILRDRHRSLFPIIIVAIGVMLTVLVHSWITGILGDMINNNANFSTGHVKVVTKAYAENMDQAPNDLAMLGVDTLINELKNKYPQMDWVERIRFGGLLDAPDKNGETRAQGTVIGTAIDFLSGDSSEIRRLNVKDALVRGRLPEKPGEIMISDDFARKLGTDPGDEVTLLSSTMYGSMTMVNYKIAGTVRFGIAVMDKGAMLMDIRDAQYAFDMNDAAGEVLGYLKSGFYNNRIATEIQSEFNAAHDTTSDEFAPYMLRLRDQQGLAGMLDMISSMVGIFIFVFILAMSLVLWNAGLLGGLRRFGEMGLRLAIGENKGHVYRSLIYESVLIGVIGSIIGTIIGLGLAWILQTKGISFGSAMQNATMMLPNTFRAHITAPAFYIGFIPGLFSTVLGTMLSGIGIYRRQTAQLFKELEV